MNTKSKKIAALILAAGESKRLGQPKQNLPFKKTTLLNHIKEHLSLNIVEETFIVLGAYAREIRKKSQLKDAEVIEFDGWKEGMGSSLAYACSKILSEKNYDGILITLSDLPLIQESDYGKMIDLFNSPEDIVATKANNSLGVPAIFGADYFSDLIGLKGKRGAKTIIQKNMDKVLEFKNENAAFDIDTIETYWELIKPKS